MTVIDLFRLTDKVAIVTGAARGLGKQAALALAEAGADVAICDLLEAEAAETAGEIEALGCRSISARVDITKRGEIETFVTSVIERLGKVDILVNNAARPSQGLSLEQVDDEVWNDIININLSGMFYFTKPVAKHMIERGQGGAIVNVASINSYVISNIRPRHNVVYCVSKGGVAQLTRGMAADWAEYGIRVNAIAPGFIPTGQTAQSRAQPEIVDRILGMTPMGRYGRPDEIKGTIVYLASDATTFMTGSVIIIDGGITIY
jgi:NAD(P)-dependent dehydrogenase (short-subunit alcohol dehydrogenase family)